MCAQAFYPSGQQTCPNSNSPQDILTQDAASAGPMSKGREDQKQRPDMTLKTLSVPHVYTGSGFSNELVQSSVMHEGKRDTQKQTHGKSSDSHIVERRLVIDSATFLSSEASLVLETSLQIKALT